MCSKKLRFLFQRLGNLDEIKRPKPKADIVTAASEEVLKDIFPAQQCGKNCKENQRCIDFCMKSKSENNNLNFTYTNRCAVWMIFSKDEESALVPMVSKTNTIY